MADDTPLPVLTQRRRPSAREALAGVPMSGRAGYSPARSLYIHVPFCFHKCHYCDFYSIVDNRDRQGPFVDRLLIELGELAPYARGQPLRTIFVGGGTPSLLRTELWEKLLSGLAQHFDLSAMRSGDGEFTVECNPETVNPGLMATLKRGGVNRVSIGAQSFDPRHLKTLERWHEPENVGRAVTMARNAGIERQNVDLIFGIPGQSLKDWESDMGRALDLGTEHMSCYDLTYEAGTAMTARLKRGEFAPADEDLEVEMYEATVTALRRAGLNRYEVSNYARPGAECRHNLAYWRQEQWLAAGPAASAHIAGRRWKNVPRLDDYLTGSDGGFAPVMDFEGPDAVRALSEFIMTGLRLAEGLSVRVIVERTNKIKTGAFGRLCIRVERWKESGHIVSTTPRPDLDISGRWRLTDAGFLIADSIAADLMAAL